MQAARTEDPQKRFPGTTDLGELGEDCCFTHGLCLVLPGGRRGGCAQAGKVQKPGHSSILVCSLPAMQARSRASTNTLTAAGHGVHQPLACPVMTTTVP